MKRLMLGLSVAVLLVPSAFAQSTAPSGRQVTLVGRVVDAACFMIHPPAAAIASHADCGKACAMRGVPLAIANEADGQLYFPTDGNKQLLALHNETVKVTGTAGRKSEPMELKMPVGDQNTLAVQVTGGYNVVTIASIEKTPAGADKAKGQ